MHITSTCISVGPKNFWDHYRCILCGLLIFEPILVHGVKGRTLKALKGLPLFLLSYLSVCMYVCGQSTGQTVWHRNLYLKIWSLRLYQEIFYSFSEILIFYLFNILWPFFRVHFFGYLLSINERHVTHFDPENYNLQETKMQSDRGLLNDIRHHNFLFNK